MLSEPALKRLGGMWAFTPSGGGPINLKYAGVYLVDRALDVDPEIIIDDLLRFAASGTIELTTVFSVEGVTVTGTVDLGGGYSVEQPSSVPQPQPVSPVFSDNNVPAHGWGAPPACAFVLRRTYEGLVQGPAPGEAPLLHVDSSPVDTQMRYILDAAMLASTGAPQFRQQYHVVTSPGWPFMDCGGYAASEEFPLPVPFNRAIDVSRMPEFYQLMKSREGRLDMALSKLKSSRQRQSKAERALDLGTCMEIMLTHGQGQSSEITNKIASRAAWILGTDGESRIEVFKRATALYSARSQAVHSGSLRPPKGGASIEREAAENGLFSSYDSLCRDLIVAIAGSDFWTSDPDWTSLVMDALPKKSS